MLLKLQVWYRLMVFSFCAGRFSFPRVDLPITNKPESAHVEDQSFVYKCPFCLAKSGQIVEHGGGNYANRCPLVRNLCLRCLCDTNSPDSTHSAAIQCKIPFACSNPKVCFKCYSTLQPGSRDNYHGRDGTCVGSFVREYVVARYQLGGMDHDKYPTIVQYRNFLVAMHKPSQWCNMAREFFRLLRHLLDIGKCICIVCEDESMSVTVCLMDT